MGPYAAAGRKQSSTIKQHCTPSTSWSSACSHTAVGLHPICCKSANVFVLVTLAWGACPSWSHKRSVGLSPFYPLYTQILEEVSALWGQVQSQTHMGLSLVAESHLDIFLYLDCPQWWQALFLQSGRFCTTQSHCPHQKLLPNQQILLHVLTLTLQSNCRQNLIITFLQMFSFQCTCCWHQLKKAWW